MKHVREIIAYGGKFGEEETLYKKQDGEKTPGGNERQKGKWREKGEENAGGKEEPTKTTVGWEVEIGQKNVFLYLF